jgi:hypothetical protein
MTRRSLRRGVDRLPPSGSCRWAGGAVLLAVLLGTTGAMSTAQVASASADLVTCSQSAFDAAAAAGGKVVFGISCSLTLTQPVQIPSSLDVTIESGGNTVVLCSAARSISPGSSSPTARFEARRVATERPVRLQRGASGERSASPGNRATRADPAVPAVPVSLGKAAPSISRQGPPRSPR